MDFLLLVVVSCAIAAVGIMYTIFIQRRNLTGGGKNKPSRGQPARIGGLRAARQAAPEEDDPGSIDDEEEEEEDTGPQTRSVRLQKRKLAKLREREARREQQEALVAQRRDRQLRMEQQRDEENLVEQEREAAEMERMREVEQEKREKADAEYKSWVGVIDVEAKGEAAAEDDEQRQHMIADLLEHVRKEKTIVLDDVRREFGISVDNLVQTIEMLIDRGDISGVFDDRGKFIAITEQEYRAIAQFMRQRGRVSVAEVLQECNRVVALVGGEGNEDAADDGSAGVGFVIG